MARDDRTGQWENNGPVHNRSPWVAVVGIVPNADRRSVQAITLPGLSRSIHSFSSRPRRAGGKFVQERRKVGLNHSNFGGRNRDQCWPVILDDERIRELTGRISLRSCCRSRWFRDAGTIANCGTRRLTEIRAQNRSPFRAPGLGRSYSGSAHPTLVLDATHVCPRRSRRSGDQRWFP